MASAAASDSTTIEIEARGLRQVMSVVHTWSSLVPIWVLYFVFITGSVGYFHVEVSNWMKPEIAHVAEPINDATMIELADTFLNENAATSSRWLITMPSDRKDTASLRWFRDISPEERQKLSPEEQEALRESNSGSVELDPVSGATYSKEDVRATGGGNLLYRMHYILHYLPRTLAEHIVVISTILMFAALVTGIIIHKKIFKDFFTFRPAKGQRSWLDVHNIFSVMTLPFQLMITYSGMLFYVATIMPLVLYGPAITLGFDVENALSAESLDDLSPKNRELFEIVLEDVLGQEFPIQAAGVQSDMVPLAQLLSDYHSRHPDQRAATIVLENPYDRNASATIRSGTGVVRGALATEVYDATTGERLIEPEKEVAGSVSGSIQQTFLALHEGRFSPIALRWLYFLTGLCGAAMIASGAVLWVRKRRQAYEAELKRFAKKSAGSAEAFVAPKVGKGVIFVERMNVATIIGLPIGVAAYFLANRLLPLGLEGRGSLEADAMFITWTLTFVIAVVRPSARIWTELMWLACAAYAAVPFVNAITTDRHLAASVLAGDWMMAGFDLTMFAIAALFGLAAHRSAAKEGALKVATKPVLRRPTLDPAE